MRVVIVSENEEILSVYTIRKFIHIVNMSYGKEKFNISTLNEAIDWYVDNTEFISINCQEVQTYLGDEV